MAFSKKGLGETPNTTLANLNVTSLISSSKAFFTQRNRKTSQSVGLRSSKRLSVYLLRGPQDKTEI